jgi:Transposase
LQGRQSSGVTVANRSAASEKAVMTVDRYHLVQLLNQAMDEIRAGRAASEPDLKGSR